MPELLSLCGRRPAHPASLPWVMSAPISARMHTADIRFMPGTVRSREILLFYDYLVGEEVGGLPRGGMPVGQGTGVGDDDADELRIEN